MQKEFSTSTLRRIHEYIQEPIWCSTFTLMSIEFDKITSINLDWNNGYVIEVIHMTLYSF